MLMNRPVRRSLLWALCLFFASITSTFLSAQNNTECFGLFFPNIQANPGDTVCIPLMVRDFEFIAAMQFVTRWDTSKLELLNLDYYLESDIPDLSSIYFLCMDLSVVPALIYCFT